MTDKPCATPICKTARRAHRHIKKRWAAVVSVLATVAAAVAADPGLALAGLEAVKEVLPLLGTFVGGWGYVLLTVVVAGGVAVLRKLLKKRAGAKDGVDADADEGGGA